MARRHALNVGDLALVQELEEQAQVVTVVGDGAGAVVADLQVALEAVQEFVKFHGGLSDT